MLRSFVVLTSSIVIGAWGLATPTMAALNTGELKNSPEQIGESDELLIAGIFDKLREARLERQEIRRARTETRRARREARDDRRYDRRLDRSDVRRERSNVRRDRRNNRTTVRVNRRENR